MGNILKGYLQLCRPPNLPTAAADIVAGLALAGFFAQGSGGPFLRFEDAMAIVLVLASVLLYAGGVVLNDVFDAALDKVERPERPIPKGIVPVKDAFFFGTVLLLLGVVLSFFVGELHGGIAVLLALAIVSYDKFSKQHHFFGPLNMGVCRGLNLLLGMAYLGSFTNALYCLIPVFYIFAITRVSQGEVHGENKKSIALAGILYVFVILFVIVLNHSLGTVGNAYFYFLLIFGAAVFIPLRIAYRNNGPLQIKNAVKAGVLSLILLDATMAVAHSSWTVGVLIVLLLPLSILLSRIFAVT
ncbi:MAG: UbiA-like protein EboC [Bacteroidota bacterium]